MSQLFFIDESGHFGKTTPCEVNGGIVLSDERVWPFVQQMQQREQAAFGDQLHKYGAEIKGSHLLDKDRFKWASQSPLLGDVARRKGAMSFLNKGRENKKRAKCGEPAIAPTKMEFAAYGQACLLLAQGIFESLQASDAKIFASIIPCASERPATYEAEEYLRKDYVFLLERYFYYLEEKAEQGLIVRDQSEKAHDRKQAQLLQRYFTQSSKGRVRALRILPSPLFVASDLTYPVQAADVCIYCVNWGYRIPDKMKEPARPEIKTEFEPWIKRLQYNCLVDNYRSYSLVYVPDPYSSRAGRQA